MRETKRKPVTVGEMLNEEFLEPMGITKIQLADKIDVHRNTIGNLVNGKAALTAPLANKLAAAFGNSPDFWLNIQHAVDIWEAKNSFSSVTALIKPFESTEQFAFA